MTDAEILDKLAGVIQAALGRKLRRERYASNVFAAECINGDHRSKRGINSAAKAKQSGLEPAFMHVIPQAEDQRFVGFFFVGGLSVFDRRRLIEIHDNKVLVECLSLRNELSALVEGETAPIENELIIPAHQIAKEQRAASLGSQLRKHFTADAVLTQRPRRGGDVHQEPGAGSSKFHRGIASIAAIAPEILVVPDVFTNGNAELRLESHRLVLDCRFKIAIFIEYIVCGKK